MDEFRELPHDIDTERAILGLALQSPKLLAHASASVDGSHFYRPAHQDLWTLLVTERDAGRPTDLVSINTAVQSHPTLSKVLAADPTWVHTIWRVGDAVGAASLPTLVATLIDKARRRAVVEVAKRAADRAYEYEAAETVIDHAHEEITKLKYAAMATDDLESLLTYEEFVGQDTPEQVLVCGDLLALGERLVITGTEGTGKTVLSRQMAVACAAGMHPFQMTPCQPKRVLALDLENPLDIMARSWRKLGNYAERRGLPIRDGRLMIDRRPSGLDLASVADQRWLSRRVETVRPDLLVIGPVYKMYIGGSNDREEDRARLVTAFLDKLRESTGCALILEHHSPHKSSALKHRDLRPIGSSLWLRWPEFGYGIRYTDDDDAQDDRRVHFLAWRGARDERPWPRQLEADKRGGWGFVEVPPDRQRTGWAS